MKKVLSLLLVVMMTVSLVATTAFAANGNFTFSLDKTEYAAGDTVVVTVNSLAKTITTEGFNVKYDPAQVSFSAIKADGVVVPAPALIYLEYDFYGVSVEKVRFQVAENNASESQVAFGFGATDNQTYFAKDGLVTIEFTVNEGATGDLTFILNENSGGTNGYVGVVDTQTAAVKGNEPEKDEEKTVDAGTLNNTAETKTFQATIGADLIGTGVTAVLAHPTHGEQEVGLTFDGWSGEAKAVFNIVVKFLDYANAADTTLSFK